MRSWKKDGDKHLRGAWGAGSQSTQERKIKSGKEFQKQASQSYSLTAMVEKKKAVAAEQAENGIGLAKDMSIPAACDPSVSQRQTFKDLRKDAWIDLTRLLDLVTEQEKKYGYGLGLKSNFNQRHLMVKHFLAIQKRKPAENRRDLAEIVASTFDRGKTSGRLIINWENFMG